MDTRFIKDAVGWGIGLWLIGYLLGFAFFFVVPLHLIGWFITPIAVVITLWILLKKIGGSSLAYYAKVAAVWVAIAVVFDYLFIVQLLQPTDGYYKFDVYLYYVLTVGLPLVVGWYKQRRVSEVEQVV